MESKTPMSKKNIVGAAVVVLLAAYGGATWYMGESARKHYEEALEEAKGFLGPQAVVSHQYERGFWTSHAKLVLQWSPPAAADADDAPVPPPIRIAVDSTLRHGPLAGARVAAAVVESHFAVEGLDENARQALAKVSPPTLTTVHRLMGGHDIHFAMPAGEMGEGDQRVSWQALTYQMSLDAARHKVSGSFQWPEMSLSGVQTHPSYEDDEGEDDDSPASAPSGPAERFTMALQGMGGDFDMQFEDGLWMLAPGSGKGRFDKIVLTRTQGEAPAQTLLALQDLRYSAAIERTGNTLGWTTKAQTQGTAGPLVFEAVGLEETVSRIDVEAVKLFQKALLAAYRSDPAQAMLLEGPEVEALWKEAAPLFVAALPAYAVKLSATLEGQQATLEYGAEIQAAPTADEVKERGWGPALLKGSLLHAGMRLPKAWLPRIVQAMGQKDMPADQIDAMVGMAQAQGFVKQEADQLITAVRMEGGKLQLNGKALDLPMLKPAH